MVTCCAISLTSTPSAAAALNTLAPSQCSGSPCSRALHVHATAVGDRDAANHREITQLVAQSKYCLKTSS